MPGKARHGGGEPKVRGIDLDLDRRRPHLTIGEVYADAWRIYRLLLRRTIATGAVVFGLVALVDVARDHTSGLGAAIGFGILGFVVDWGAPVFVQGALIEIVRNVHEGRVAKPIGALYAKARKRFWPLFWASIFYSIGVFFGLVLLIVPGLLAAARWSLMAPFVVLEDDDPGDALDKSRAVVPERPVIHEDVARWRSVWAGA